MCCITPHKQISTDTMNRQTDHQDLQDISDSKSHTQLKKIQTVFLIIILEIYKCLGHTYDTGNIIVHSFYLVIEKNNTTPKKGDIVVSNTSDGFIETVVKVHRTNNFDYLETKFQRCEASSHWKGSRYLYE